MEKTILSIAGKPGLFTLVSRSRTTLIVETLDDQKKRFTVGLHDRITSLNDVSMYADTEDVSLMKVFKNIFDTLKGEPVGFEPKKASKAELEDFMAMALPDYDRDRVYQNDMRKLATWYNILVKNGMTDFSEEESSETNE